MAAALFAFGLVTPCQAGSPAQDATVADREPIAGTFLVRGRIVGSIPVNQQSRVEPVGGRVVTPARALPDFDVTYFLTNHFAIAGQGGIVATRTRLQGSVIGDFPIGTTWSASATGAVQFHLFPGAAFKPYVGAGVGFTAPLAYEPAKPFVTAMKADPQLGPMLQAGLDYHLGGRWYANVEVKQIFLPTQVSRIGGGSATVKLDMLIIGAGLGYRF